MPGQRPRDERCGNVAAKVVPVMMDVEVGRPDGVTVIGLYGELDVDAAVHPQATLSELVDRRATRIVVDLAGLTFCDPVSLLTFVNAHRSCTRLDGYLRLAAPAPPLLPTLAQADTLAPIPTYTTVDAARGGDPASLIRPTQQSRSEDPREDR
jgi:anti-anti-sigma factor